MSAYVFTLDIVVMHCFACGVQALPVCVNTINTECSTMHIADIIEFVFLSQCRRSWGSRECSCIR